MSIKSLFHMRSIPILLLLTFSAVSWADEIDRRAAQEAHYFLITQQKDAVFEDHKCIRRFGVIESDTDIVASVDKLLITHERLIKAIEDAMKGEQEIRVVEELARDQDVAYTELSDLLSLTTFKESEKNARCIERLGYISRTLPRLISYALDPVPARELYQAPN